MGFDSTVPLPSESGIARVTWTTYLPGRSILNSLFIVAMAVNEFPGFKTSEILLPFFIRRPSRRHALGISRFNHVLKLGRTGFAWASPHSDLVWSIVGKGDLDVDL
jgi:hypothetical protein